MITARLPLLLMIMLTVASCPSVLADESGQHWRRECCSTAIADSTSSTSSMLR